MTCKVCGSEKVIRWGTRKNKQVWRCKSCGRYFTSGEKRKREERPIIFNYSLGYVVGVLVGDGSISRWRDYHYFDERGQQVPKAKATRIVPRFRYGFQLQCKDKDFAETFARHLQEVTGRDVSPYPIKHKPVTEMAGNKLSKPYTFHGFRVQLTHKELYDKIKPLTEGLSWIKDADIEVRRGFLRGIVDSDGGVTKRPRVHLTNKDVNLLHLVRSLLDELGIKGHICPMGTLFRLWIHSRENVKRFFKTIGFSIQRKKEGKLRL